MDIEQEGISIEGANLETTEGIELPAVDDLEDSNADNSASTNTDNQSNGNDEGSNTNDNTDNSSEEDEEKINLQKSLNYERKLRKEAEKKNKKLEAALTENSNKEKEKDTLQDLINSGVDESIAKSIISAINKKNESSNNLEKELAEANFKVELLEKSKESNFSDIVDYEDEVKTLVDKGLTIEQAYYALTGDKSKTKNTKSEIERKVEAKIQNNQTRKQILGNVNSNAGNAIKSSDTTPKATATEIAMAKMAGIDINEYLAAKNADSFRQYNDYQNRKVK
mgnify:CR=1 FL=1